MIVSKVATQSNQVAAPKQGVTFTDEPASQAPRPVTSTPVQQVKTTTPTQTANASTPANAKQQYVIPQKSTPSDISAPNQQAVGQIAEKGDLTLNRDANQSVSLNANGQRVLTVCGVDNVTQKNGQTTVYSYDNGQIHQFDKNLNMTSGPSDHTILQNDGKGAIYISDGKPYQAQAYPEGYTRLTKTANGLELQKVPTRTVNTFTQDGKTNCVFPGRGTSKSVSSYKVNNDESVTITLANGTQETLQNNWVKPVPTAISNNLNVEKKSDNNRDNSLAQAPKTNNSQNNGTVLETGAGYQVVQKGSSIIVNYNSKQVVAYNNVTNLKKDANGLTFNANNGGLYITLGKPQSNSLGNHLPFNQSETEQALLNDTKDSNILYLGRNNTAFSPLEDTRYFQTIEKRGNQYYYMQQGTGVGGAFTRNKGAGVDNGGEAEAEITNVKFAPNGDVTFTEVHGGKTMTLTNNWLRLNNTSNSNKPTSNTSSPNSKNNTSASTTNKGSQAGSTAKGSASVAGQSQGKASATPGQSREPASNPNDVQHGGNTPASAAKGSTSANKPAASVGNKASQAKGSQAGGHTASAGKASAGKGSVSASASAGKTSTTPTNKTSQGSAAVKGSVSASKTQAQSQSANGSAAKGSVSVNQSSAASQSGKGNQWQSQGQHVNVIKHPAKIVKASAPVAQLAAKRVASAPAEETTAPVAEQASAPVETAAPAAQQTAAAPVAKTATPSAAQSSGSSLSSMPNTGMNNEVAAELEMAGAGLVLGIAAKRKSKEK